MGPPEAFTREKHLPIESNRAQREKQKTESPVNYRRRFSKNLRRFSVPFFKRLSLPP
jgi:hypothetical protein